MIAINTALFVVDYLIRSGLRRVHVVPDPEIAPLLDAFRLRGSRIISLSDATAAAMLASAESAIGQGFGVILAGAGRSAASIAPVVAQAQIERRSLIAITINSDGAPSVTGASSRLDLRAMYASLCKGSYRLSAANAQELVPLAFLLATTAPAGAVHLRIRDEELTEDAPAARRPAQTPPTPFNGNRQSLVDQARRRVEEAERIAIVVGPEAIYDRAEAAVRLLAEEWGAPVVVTPGAKGALPERHPLFAGVLGGAADGPVQALLAAADLVVAFGVSGHDLIRPWSAPAPVMLMTRDVAAGGLRSDLVLAGPLNSLANLVSRGGARPRAGEVDARRVRQAIHDALGLAEPTDDYASPVLMLDRLAGLVTGGTPLAVETGPAGLLAAQAWPVDEPRSFLIGAGLGLPATGLALAITAAMERADGRAVWLGSHDDLIAHVEMLTQVRDLRLKLTLILVDDGVRVDLARAQQAAAYPRVAVDRVPPELEALAAAFALRYAPLRTAEELRPTLATALTSDTATLIDAVVPEDTWLRLA